MFLPPQRTPGQSTRKTRSWQGSCGTGPSKHWPNMGIENSEEQLFIDRRSKHLCSQRLTCEIARPRVQSQNLCQICQIEKAPRRSCSSPNIAPSAIPPSLQRPSLSKKITLDAAQEAEPKKLLDTVVARRAPTAHLSPRESSVEPARRRASRTVEKAHERNRWLGGSLKP